MGHIPSSQTGAGVMSVLRTDRLCRSFGNLVVTRDLSLEVQRGERHIIIGPNGAGKTSLANQIGGQLRPSSGRIFLEDVDITGQSPDRINRLGIARTFQKNNLFPNLSILENLRLAVQARRGHTLNCVRPVAHYSAVLDRARELAAIVHIEGEGSRLVRHLSYGEQRQLEIGMALASEPKLLLLDEPTSGMSPLETQRMIELIRDLPSDLAILMIEHDMKVVFSLADRVTVLYYGEALASGTCAEVQASARVREVYLGMAG
ncbi:ABC transporter ATP-binding protein [Roseiarcaceae bacterium H3SJ34-1]|uniref:ABC transporter ATP-binding protein n=1 Tax=Terripilifer ovatus TaxID=3032367 RepID=UPI003AB9874E|nr:ABC transporter ATP-binding protein [Roseiarcaceae bacterium H3SJ34-1]